MPVIDDRGRLFGRLNIIDGALLAFVLILLPIGYTATRLFRVPLPEIQSVEPATQPIGPDRRIRLNGHDFRPYLKAFISPTGQPFSLVNRTAEAIEGRFLVETPTLVEIALPRLAVGQYDLYLYDETQEVARRLGAFVLTPPPSVTVRVRVRFSVPAELTLLVHEGDHDLFDGRNVTAADVATLKAVRRSAKRGAALELLEPGEPNITLGLVEGPVTMLDAEVDIPAIPNMIGVPQYHDRPIRVGDPFLFQTAQYAMRGLIAAVAEPTDSAALPAGK